MSQIYILHNIYIFCIYIFVDAEKILTLGEYTYFLHQEK